MLLADACSKYVGGLSSRIKMLCQELRWDVDGEILDVFILQYSNNRYRYVDPPPHQYYFEHK